MFEKRTVIITGAGASWHYGYPTGETLVQKVIEKARIASQFFRNTANSRLPNALSIQPELFSRYPSLEGASQDVKTNWLTAANECDELEKRLTEVRPLVIDYFLGQNDSVRDIGKLMIAWVIRECAVRRMQDPVNINRRRRNREIAGDPTRDDWYRFIVHKLVNGCTNAKALHDNKVTFITFNYDVSLEWYVERALASIELFSDQVHEFFRRNPVLHVYGSIVQHPDDSSKTLDLPHVNVNALARDLNAQVSAYMAAKELLDRAFESATRIRTIGPHDKDEDMDVIKRAREAIAETECVYLLGYGFDENNSARLELQKHLRLHAGTKRVVLFTNHEDKNIINKKASQVFFGHSNQFLPPQAPIWRDAKHYYEKSTRSVYDALDSDFDSVEQAWGYPLA